MARAWLMLVLACGCRQIWGLGHTPESELDGGTNHDTSGEAPDAANCFGRLVGQSFCLAALPIDDKTFPTSQTIDTDRDPLCDPGITSACVVAGATISITGTLSGTGSRPLVLLALGALQIDGTVDVSSTANGPIGAGSEPVDCHIGAIAMISGGGAGGSFGGSGGNGGNGMELGGSAGGATSLTTLRGGCSGGDGEGIMPASAGNGGGAVYFYSDASITVNGTINASGAGGHGGQMSASCGGAGGGSGGMIIVDAPTVNTTPSALILASGGGGGEGGSPSTNGATGGDPQDTGQAFGGNGGSTGGRGGRGSGGGSLDGQVGETNNQVTGGGGGGGAGFIHALVALGGKVQPPAN